MKRNYRNETVVDFQGRTDRQVTDNYKIGCFTIVLGFVVVVVLIVTYAIF
jgi:hypothetical protein